MCSTRCETVIILNNEYEASRHGDETVKFGYNVQVVSYNLIQFSLVYFRAESATRLPIADIVQHNNNNNNNNFIMYLRTAPVPSDYFIYIYVCVCVCVCGRLCVFVVRNGNPRNRGSILSRGKIFFACSERENWLGADVAYSVVQCVTEVLSPG